MITKILINADAIDARNEANCKEVIKKPPCFFAYRDKSLVSYRKIDESGKVDTSIRAKKIPLANFIANFKTFDGDFSVPEDFNKKVVFFIGKAGLRKDYAVPMPHDFCLTDDNGDISKFKKGDILITTQTGINLAVEHDYYDNQYISENDLHLFVEPSFEFVNRKENANDMTI